MDYKQKLKKKSLLMKAKKWLKKNPPPKNWQASKWAWAYTEMPVFGNNNNDELLPR